MGTSTLLGRTSGPTINSMEAGVKLSEVILENAVMDTIEAQGRGVTMDFSTDTTAGQIKVLRFLPLEQKARRLGATLNGGAFNGISAEFPRSSIEYLNILDAIDGNIDIPNMTQSMINVNILDAQQKLIAQLVSKTLNALTVAGKVKTTFNAEEDFVEYTAGTDDLAEKLMTLSATLDAGDRSHGIQSFPKDDRIFLFRSSFLPAAYKNGILIVGGANVAYEMLAKGAVSPDATVLGNVGYYGKYLGIPMHFVSPQIFEDACAYLGLPTTELDNVYGYCSSGVANARALAYDNQIKIIDSPAGAGIRLQPQYRFGFESWYPKGNVFLTKAGYTNTVTALKTWDSTYKLDTMPAGSRQEASVTWSSKTPTLTLGTGATTSKQQACFVAKANRVSPLTASGIIGATKAKALADFTSETAITFATAGDYYPYAIVELSDGTIVVSEGAMITNS